MRWLPRHFKSDLEKSAFYKLARAYAPPKGQIVLIVVLGLAIAGVEPGAVYLTQRILDAVKSQDLLAQQRLPFTLVLVFFGAGWGRFFYNSERRLLTERFVLRVREALFRRYLVMPMPNLDAAAVGDLLSYLQNDLAHLNLGLDTLTLTIREPFAFIGLIALAFYYDPLLTLLALASTPLIVFLFSVSGKAVKRYSTRTLGDFSELMSCAQEALLGARVVKLFHLETVLGQKWADIQARYWRKLSKSIRIQEIPTPAVELVGATLMAIVIMIGSRQIAAGTLSAGKLVAFVLALGLAQMPIKKMNSAFLKLKNASAAAERIYGFLEETPCESPLSLEEKVTMASFQRGQRAWGRVCFEKVSVDYRDRCALNSLSFSIEPGEVVALVGKSGSGKSTTVAALARLYPLSSGDISLHGVSLTQCRVQDWRAEMSFVFQDAFLFRDTVYENIRMGRPSATTREIEIAAERAGCLSFIERHKDGWNRRLGDGGTGLSGGERQRLAIARAFLKDAPLLILDEATAHLDKENASSIENILDTLMVHKTVIWITHRWDRLGQADRVLVLEKGELVEQGKYAELVKSGNYFPSLLERDRVSVSQESGAS